MADKKKPKPVVIADICPYCEGVRTFTSKWYVEDHIKAHHPEKRRSVI
tara:strand:- start:3116 stop:3259 length:144 start_codon:yes stop_codon:yes gene_type:complete